MGLSVANILLQVTGDSDDARRELEAVSRDLALFGRETAEAEVDVNTASARANLEELEGALADFSADDHSTEINVLIAKAQADIAVLQAELERIDKEEVTVDVDVRRGVVEKIAALNKEIEGIGKATQTAAQGGISAFVSSIGEAWKGASIFGVSLTSIAVAAPFVIAAVVAIVGQLVAVVASAVSAAGGVAALAVAFTSVLIPGIALAVGAIANFKEDAETAGTAAHALKSNLGEVATAFKDATAGGSNALFRGLSDGLKEIAPLIENLGPAFTRLGEAGGDAIRLLADQFSSPAWQKFFTFTIDSLAKLTPLFAESFGAFANILKNIATAAMPFLIKAFEGLADGLDSVAEKTSDIGGLRDVIGGMVHSLAAFGELLGGLTDLTAAFVEAFAPFGDSIVESLADGAHSLADWLRSSEGLDEVKQFFETTGPLASELAKLVGNVGIAFIQIAEIVAPALTVVVGLLNAVFSAANKALDYITDNASAVGRVLLAVVAPITVLKDAFGPIKGAAEAAFEAIKTGAGAVAAVLAAPIQFVIGFASDLPGRARSIWDSVKGAIEDAIKFVLQFAIDLACRARNIWDAVKGVVSDAINFVLSLPGDLASRARNIWDAVKGVIDDAINFVLDLPGVGGLVSAAKAIWDAINDALPDISINIDIPKPSLPDISLPGHASGVRSSGTSHLALVGEQGPELRFIPKGTDVFTAGETQRILRALAGGVSAPVAVSGGGTAGAGGGDTYVDVKVVSPGTGSPDPDIAAAKWNATLRARGAIA